MANVLTTCPFCASGCNLYLRTEAGRLVGVMPSQSHPVSRGKLCIRGWHAHEFVSHPRRLRTPLVRKNGDLRPASWEEALALVARRLPRGRDVGVVGSARCSNEDNYLLMKLARGVLGTDHLDFSSRPARIADLAALQSALGVAAATNSLPELADAEVITVIGADLVGEATMVASLIYEALARGATLISISPVATRLSALAELDLRPRPGSEPCLMCGLLKSVIDQGLMDSSLLDRDWGAYDEFATSLSQFTLERVERDTGVAAADVERAARLCGGTRKSMVLYSAGLSQHPAAATMATAAADLVALTNHLGQPAMGLVPLAGENNFQGALDMGLAPGTLTGGQALDDPGARQRFEAAWGCPLPAAAGQPLPQMLAGVSGLYVMGADVVGGAADPAAARRRLEALDFLLVQELFMTETARLAQVVLPAACYAEQDGTFTAADRRVQRVRTAVDAPGEARPDWQIVQDLAAHLDVSWGYDSAAAIMAEIASLTPRYAGISYERLDADWGAFWPGADGGGERLHLKGLALRALAPLPAPPRADDAHPYLLLLDPTAERWTADATVAHSEMLRREYGIATADFPQGWVSINPQDAQELQLRQGVPVKVSSPHGEARLQLRLDPAVAPGTLTAPYSLRAQVHDLLGGPAAGEVEGHHGCAPVAVSVSAAGA